MHGKDASPADKWYPWFGAQVEQLEYEYIAPTLPNSSDPDINEWMGELDKLDIGADDILVGHSRGGVAILRWLEQQPAEVQVARVVLVATNAGTIADMAVPSETNHGFYTQDGYDFEKIKSHCDNFVVLHSRDDKWVPYDAGVANAEGLDAQFLSFEDKGHFGKATPEVPEILEACINFDARKALILPVNSKGEILIQDRRNFKKPNWGFFGKGIDGDETPLEAVIRETKEELDIDITAQDLVYLGASTTLWSGKTIIRYLYLYKTNQNEFTVYEGKAAYWMNFEMADKYLESEDKFQELVSLIRNH